MRIEGSSVLLTGASGGLGQAIARALAGKGAKLVLSGTKADVLDSLAKELHARAVQADLSRAEEVQRLAAEAGPVEILIANAGLQAGGLLQSCDVAQIDAALDVNLRAPIVLARLLMDAMVQRKHGHIVFVSSLNGKAPVPRSSVYCASKFGLRGFSHGLRADLRASGVGVSVICPGFVRDAGMFARSQTKLPPGVGTCTPDDVARGVIRAIERNRAEVDVAPLSLRAGAAVANLMPELAAAVTRLAGGDRIAASVSGDR